MDKLEALFSNVSLTAREVYTGPVCGDAVFDDTVGLGCLHVIRSGCLTASIQHHDKIDIYQPNLLFLPRPLKHEFHSGFGPVAEITCALVEFASGLNNPLISALPDFILIPLSSSREIEKAVMILFDEAFNDRSGRQAAMNRLFEYVIILLLRFVIEEKSLNCGVLAGLADERLSRAITAIHEHPEQSFSLEDLAKIAGMSRARFASNFHRVVGTTPINYLTDWRISIAMTLLKKGMPINIVAQTVGYSGCASFTRVFSNKTGSSPRDWYRANQ
ncbi:AraC-type DNA-binding protein [Trichlorobacter thiogenes]|uniref:AraC-type DNA-binding protein n=1 Tax=Trichlorobacter thiogenes TaxID=115783 RepID=A0A1T4KSI4_9BACT|nr:AraC family transcriptional regulator [Trichlorobacter thiogenes]SJZ45404.1 AraC-type DNA-binding protein [Trichlorobacter thiogenes]